jgi:hypothetical protein
MMAGSCPTTSAGLNRVRVGIVAFGLTTAIIHIVLAVPLTLIGLYLNGLGYIVLVTALFVPRLRGYRRQIRWVLMGYTALTILLWVVLGQPYTTIGYVDKGVEVGLIGLLWLDQRRSAERKSSHGLADPAQ